MKLRPRNSRPGLISVSDREEATDVFRRRYRVRSGIEGTNSGLKRRTGLGRLRVRGQPRLFHAIYLKINGWNILRASVCAAMREIVYERAEKALFCARRLGWPVTLPLGADRKPPHRGRWPSLRPSPPLAKLSIAA